MASGTGQSKIAKLYLASGRVINVQSFEEKYNPNAEGHSSIDTDRVIWHTTALKEWSVDVEIEIQEGTDPLHPSEIDENNPADLLIIDARENRRYVQGILTDESYSSKKQETMKHKFTLGHFKDRVFE